MRVRRATGRVLFLLLVAFTILPPAVSAQSAALQATNSRYQVRAGDVIDFDYRQTPELNQSASVQPDGYISLRLLGDFKVAGLTLDEVRRLVRATAEKRLKDPEISVILKEYERPYFVVGGEVGTPGRFELRGPTTLLQGIFLAGGLRQNTARTQVLLFRRVNEEWAEVRSFDVKAMTSGRAAPPDPVLQPGDLLFVPQSRTGKVERFVRWTSIGMFFPLY